MKKSLQSVTHYWRPILAVLLTLTVGGCDGPTEPTEPDGHLLATGKYAYSFAFGFERYAGHLVLTSVTESEVEGRWEVPGYDDEIALRFWNVDAYVLWADPVNGGNITHRVWRKGSSSIGCLTKRIRPDGFGGITSSDAQCTLSIR